MEKRYHPAVVEPGLQKQWEGSGVYHFQKDGKHPIYAIDTPPPTVSGKLHLGHVYSYSHADFMARYFRMQGRNVFYPMGFDDNGLPTEHLVERKIGQSSQELGRQKFINACLEISEEEEMAYERLWKRLGLSIDWRYSYRTIDENARRISQQSFLNLFDKDYLYQQEAPIIWCPQCQTALAQADLNDIERMTEFVTLSFDLVGGDSLMIATTRPELLPACVALFVHPDDERYKGFVGKSARVPLFGQEVHVLADPLVDPKKGTGAVMCCTFGDQTDINWWRIYDLPLVEAVDKEGKITAVAGQFAGLPINQAREKVKRVLASEGILVECKITSQVIRVHDRDDVPVEFLSTKQWFIRILDKKAIWLDLGSKIKWHPDYMQNRYRSWVENLSWDWCISRQRYYGVPIPVWYCGECGQVLLPSPDRLPVDPLEDVPDHPCTNCGSMSFKADEDVLDTWATSSMTPQIVCRWLSDPIMFSKLFPMSLRPQAHEIIRTWTFYTIVKSFIHTGKLPWSDVLISGWGIAGEGMGKISKSRGGGPMPPMEMLEKYSADAVRYWAASTATGKDSVISEEKVGIGQKLITKLWNLARFSERFIDHSEIEIDWDQLTGADRWIFSKMNDLIEEVTKAMNRYDYAVAKNEIEKFVWVFADNYLEMAKGRLYSEDQAQKQVAKFTLKQILLNLIKLFAPFFPHVTEKIYLDLFDNKESNASIHQSQWPKKDPMYFDQRYLVFGEVLIEIASAVRRFKTEKELSLSTPIIELVLKPVSQEQSEMLHRAYPDLFSVTRAEAISIVDHIDDQFELIAENDDQIQVAIKMSA